MINPFPRFKPSKNVGFLLYGFDWFWGGQKNMGESLTSGRSRQPWPRRRLLRPALHKGLHKVGLQRSPNSCWDGSLLKRD